MYGLSVTPRQLPYASIALLLISVLCGCAGSHRSGLRDQWPDPALAACAAAFRGDDQIIAQAKSRDHQYERLAGFPFLRIDRLLAALEPGLAGNAAALAWLTHLGRKDAEARRLEWLTLSAAQRAAAPHRDMLTRCRADLIESIVQTPSRLAEVRRSALFPDDYSNMRRALGLYPLTRLVVKQRAMALQERENSFLRATDDAIAEHQVTRYALDTPVSQSRTTILPSRWAYDAAGIPIVPTADLDRLFAAHAPVFAVETQSENDRIGSVRINANTPSIDTSAATFYTFPTFTRFDGQILLQLNYTVWFPARPARGAIDILAGQFDGITWRITLDTDGTPLIADTMHNCGCYYMAFPGSRLHPKAPLDEHGEPLWIPRHLPDSANPRMQLHIAGGSHYLRAIEPFPPPAKATLVRATMAPYETLKALPFGPDRFQSMFRDDGIVAGSERMERLLLWPMGIASPGAMRVAGRHPIAFVGRRHFDDADLYDRYFERGGVTSAAGGR